jgi:hypothetical protein
MKILICGDSFAADWTVKHSGRGWPNMLAELYEVTNLAQAGCSEYKILKQLESVDLTVYDKIIVWHTSPYRIYVEQHPVHHNDPLHKDCDLIYNDIKSKVSDALQPIVEYFEKYFSTDYANFVHGLLVKHIQEILEPVKDKVIQIPQTVNFDNLVKPNIGLNHFDQSGNQLVFAEIIKLIHL